MRAFRIAYDGTAYRGFQRQPHGETVEDTVLEAVEALEIDLVDDTPPGYAAAGRTDAGVSARAQTVAFEAPEWLTPRALNGELPADVRAWAHAEVDDDFHATHDATERTYRYFLHARDRLDDERASDAASRLSGRHDYHNLTPDEAGSERDLAVTVARSGQFLVVECRASGFARELVRRLVSLLESVATEEYKREFVDRALDDAPLTGGDGIAPAPPEPLVLVDVRYAGVSFERDEAAVESARAVFRRRRRERLVGAKVAGALFPAGPAPPTTGTGDRLLRGDSTRRVDHH